MRILLVEDDRKAARLLTRALQEEGFVVDVAHSADQADELSAAADHDVIVLDWMLPGKDGLAVCRELRQRGVATPILMLTARDGLADRVTGLNTGADDYLTKPFALAELFARLQALLRRSLQARPGPLIAGDLTLDPVSHRVARGGTPVALTQKEYAILETLMRHAGEVVTRSRLAESVWEEGLELVDNVLEAHVSHLRKKIERPLGAPLIQTIRGRGYRLAPPES